MALKDINEDFFSKKERLNGGAISAAEYYGENGKEFQRDFERGLNDREKQERNYHRNIEARDKIFGEVAGIAPEEFPAPYNETRRDKLYEKGVYRKSQLPSYRAAYKRANNRYERQVRTGRGYWGQQASAPAPMAEEEQKLKGMTSQEFADYIRQQEQHNSRWNAADENGNQGNQNGQGGQGGDIPQQELPTMEILTDENGNEYFINENGERVYEFDVPDVTVEDSKNGAAFGNSDMRMAAASQKGYQEAMKTFREANPEAYETLYSAFGVDPERMQYNEEELKRIAAEKKRSGIFHGLATVADILTAAGGGDVYKREPDSRDYDKESQMIRAQEAAEALQANKDRNAYRLQLRKEAADYAKAVGKAAADNEKQNIINEEKQRYRDWKDNYQANEHDFKMKLEQFLEQGREERLKYAQQQANYRTKLSVDGAKERQEMANKGAADRQNEKDLISIVVKGTDGKRKVVKVNAALYSHYIGSLQEYIGMNMAGDDSDFMIAMMPYFTSDKNNPTKVTANKGGNGQHMVVNDGHAMPDIMRTKLNSTEQGKEIAKDFDRMWQGVLDSAKPEE